MNDRLQELYNYKANSNLVLPSASRPTDEGTGEVQSLAGRLKGRMGDREEGDKKRSKKEPTRKTKTEPSKLKLDLTETKGLSVADIDTADLLYRPKTERTAIAFGLIIKFVRRILGFQHSGIINGAADEIITTMKDSKLDDQSRRHIIERLLYDNQELNDDDYNEICNLCKKITDWESNQPEKEEPNDDADCVNVIFSDDDDASSDGYLSEVRESDDEVEQAQNDSEILSQKQPLIIPNIDVGEPIRKQGFMEYHIPPKKKPQYRKEDLMLISELPEDGRKLFGDLKELNYIQSRIYTKAMTSDKSLLICAPTGAGKTNIALLTILREILRYKRKDGSFDTDKFKIIYVAPIKALVQEIVSNFNKRLGCKPFNLVVEELTGDHQLDQRQISKAQIIVCTPEKWDIVTRKSIDRLYTKLVRLVIFDEIHLLHNDRGATLEALVARIKRHKQIEGEAIRIVGLSATLPNYKDVSHFISPNEHVDDSTCYFDSSYRPIPLKQQYIAITESKKALRMINQIVYDKVVERLVDHAQILIFVHSRPDTIKTAEFIKTVALDERKTGLFLSSDSAKDVINDHTNNVRPKIRELLQFGIGVHHAGMSKTERTNVEDLFRGRYIKVLVSTATLAWGVNLPARTVIIKGTQVYRDGKWTDLDSLDVTQMLGRAGRPGFDSEGEGIVITQQAQVFFYMSLMTEQLPVESKLLSRLPEFINAECVIGNIENLQGAIDWLSETYLFSRMNSILRNPDARQYLSMYGLKSEMKNNDPRLIIHRKDLAYTAVSNLDKRGLVIFDRSSGAMKPTELGRIASHYNCSSRTAKLFYDSIHEHTSDIELFRTFSLADEFKEIYVRRGEEADLQALINQVPFPIDDKRVTPGANKVNALLQVYIFRLNIEGSDLICDMHFIKDNASRLSRAIHEIVLLKGFSSVAELSFDLCRKIDKRMTVCHSPLRQFSDDLDANTINRLERKNYNIDELRILKPDRLCELLRCDRSTGENIHQLLGYLPKFKIEASVKPVSKSYLKIELTLYPDFTWNDKYHGYSQQLWLLVEDVNQEVLLHHEMIYLRKYSPTEDIRTTFIIPFLMPAQPFYFIRVLPDSWFGCDRQLPIHLEKLTLPDDVTLMTQLLDLEPSNLKSLGGSGFEGYYEAKFKGANFNQIQTQTFKHFYRSDEDVILLAASGSGKSTCAELAIIRVMERNKKFKIAYISANVASAQIMYENWLDMFGKFAGVYLLTGNHRLDTAKVDSDDVNIIIGDPAKWHALTLVRSKKYRKLMHKFQLFIIDDIHILYDDKTSTLEWVCSKIRIMTKMSERPARIIVLGSPMIAADSLKNWLCYERGVKEPTLFNYPPSTRPVKLDLIVQKFQYYDYRMRLLTMQRPLYRLITETSKGKPVLVFVADSYLTWSLTDMLLKYADSEGIKLSSSFVKSGKIKDPTLEKCLRRGIGYIYKGMDPRDKREVEALYDNCDLRVLIATVSSCWSLQCRSYLTVIMDTQHHDGLVPVEYDLTDVMQMVGLTGRPLSDHECKCVIMCHSSKAENYDRLLREPLPVESELPLNLIVHVNYEIATNSIVELNNIYKPYLAHTFFYKRISVNPNYYGLIAPDDPDQKSTIYGSFFNDLVNKVALDLEKNEFLTMEGSSDNPTLSPGLLSKISLEYYISYETLVAYVQWLSEDDRNFDVRSIELIELISTYTYEFSSIGIRNHELQDLKALQRRHRPREADQLQDYGFKIKLLILSQYQKTDGKPDHLEGELYDDRLFIVTTSYKLLMAIIDIAWLRDSFSLAKTSIQLAKKLVPFNRSSQPNLEMDVILVRDGDSANIEINVVREDNPFNEDEFKATTKLSPVHFREEGWCFLIHGTPKTRDEPEKFLLFKRVKTPSKGTNSYKLTLELGENPDSLSYDLYLMSDFYSSREDRRVTNIDINGMNEESVSKQHV